MPLIKNQVVRLFIESLSGDGSGVARCEGMAVFVPFSAPGDEADVRLVKLAKSHAYGKIERLYSPGPGRQTPDCPIAGRCGGCAFRHLTYETELAAKRGFVADALRRIGGLAAEVPPPLPSPEQLRYRNKLQYPIAASAAGTLCYGFYAPRSHRVVPCEDCLLQPRLLCDIARRAVSLLSKLGVPAYDEAGGSGLLRHLLLRQSALNGQVLLCLVLAQKGFAGARAFAGELAAAFGEIAGVVLNYNPARGNVILGAAGADRLLYGSADIADELCGVPLRVGVHTFAQVNSPAAKRLFRLAGQFANLKKGDTLLDLYCGGGVIGLSMASGCHRLIGADTSPQGIEAARQSAREMGITDARFICADAKAATARLAAEGLKPNVITVDPPRQGADSATLAAMLQMAPARIVMISCNPATLARDLAALAAGGYRLTRLQPMDMFPRTKHVECVALLEKI